MILAFKILGYEIWTLELELGEEDPKPVSPVDKVTKAVSRAWVRRMVK